MKSRHGLGIIIVLTFINFGYAGSFNHESSDFSDRIKKDTAKIKAAFHEDDIAANEYLKDRLKPIRTNFKRINSITQWTSVLKKTLRANLLKGEKLLFSLKAGVLKRF